MAKAKYKIDRVPGPGAEDIDGQQGPVWDVWPVCFDPDHEPTDPDTFDADAWAWGARGGLRISAFIDEFGDNGRKLSICERDFGNYLLEFGNTLEKKLQNLGIDAKLMDVDPLTPGCSPTVAWCIACPKSKMRRPIGSPTSNRHSHCPCAHRAPRRTPSPRTAGGSSSTHPPRVSLPNATRSVLGFS
jgi:hypothetical protein